MGNSEHMFQPSVPPSHPNISFITHNTLQPLYLKLLSLLCKINFCPALEEICKHFSIVCNSGTQKNTYWETIGRSLLIHLCKLRYEMLGLLMPRDFISRRYIWTDWNISRMLEQNNNVKYQLLVTFIFLTRYIKLCHQFSSYRQYWRSQWYEAYTLCR